jgi:hypothetical protein
MSEAEQTLIYQPTDSEGRPIGGKQVIKYTTQEELVSKLQEQNVLLIRKLREQTKKVRLGIEEKEELPDDAVRFSGPVEFAPRELTEEERYELARKIADPVTSAQATQELVEASLGAPLSKIGDTLKSIQQDNLALRAKIEANAFIADNPDYYKCAENYEAICSWILRYDLAPVKANFQKAYETLRGQGLLIEGPAPVTQVTPVTVEPVVEHTVETPEVVQSRIPTGITREMASDSGTAVKTGEEITYNLNGVNYTGLAAIKVMPADEYKRRLLADKNFAKLVDKLESERKR